MRRWLSTLRVQFVVVTAASVLLSSLAVFAVLELNRERELRGLRISAVAERISAVASMFAELPPNRLDQAARSMSGRFARYRVVSKPPFSREGMSADERKLAAEFADSELPFSSDDVRARVSESHSERRHRQVIDLAVPLAAERWLIAHLERRPWMPPPRSPGLLIAAIAGTIVTAGAAAWIAGRVARPISALAAAADEVAQGRAAPKLSEEGPRDVRRALAAFNVMNDRVARTLESQRQLLLAVGHDLRTPIAAMRISAEFVTDPDVRERLVRNLEELQAMTEAVLAAARERTGEPMRPVDLASLMESVCADLVDLGQKVETEIEGDAPCLCRPNEIRRAFRNLVENAVRYGARARVRLERTEKSYVAVIEDDGPGIPPDRLEHVFEPFARLEESRSGETGGAGLGLTLARAIVREHGGDVTLENRPGGGLTARLELPMGLKPTP